MLRSWLPAATLRRISTVHPFTLTPPQTARLTLAALTLGGFALRLGLLATYPLREDEAIYAFWARRWLDGDTFFMHVWPDKPPLFLWLLAGLFGLAGPDAAVGRWLNIAAGTLTIPVVAVAARRLWDAPLAGAVAALLMGLSPFGVSFSPTIYTDPLLVLWGSAAVAAALSARPGWAGVLLVAAVMTKQQGALYAPLVLALASLPLDRRAGSRLGWALLGLALAALPILWWDSLRWASAPSPWDLSARTYAPLTLAPWATWGPQLAEWGGLLWHLTASWPVWVVLGAAAMVTLGHARRNARLALILGWGLAFIAAHGLTTVQVWDRYLLPLAPWLAWVVSGPLARALNVDAVSRPQGAKLHLQKLSFRAQGAPGQAEESLWRDGEGREIPHYVRIDNWLPRVAAVSLLVLLTPPAVIAATGGYPLGGDHGDYAGLDDALAWVDVAAPGPYVLYHQPLGWQFRFYLYDDLARVDLRWFPSAVYLADNAVKTPYPAKFVVIPDWAPLRDLDLQLAQRGLVAATRLRAGRFAVVEILQPARPLCTWCVSVQPWPRRAPLDPARMSLP